MKQLLWIVLFACMMSGCTKSIEEGEQLANSILEIAHAKDIEQLEQLIARGIEVNVQDNEGRTPLMIATYHNDVASARLLIEAGADVNLQDVMLNSPFLYAGAEGLLEILQLTIHAGADPAILNRFGGTALIPAAERGHVEVVQTLLESTEVDVNHVNNLGWTALMEAVILNNGNERQQEVIRLLLENGAIPTIADKDGVTPLQHAEIKGFIEIEEQLRASEESWNN